MKNADAQVVLRSINGRSPLYGKVVSQAIRRNINRFPSEFLFQWNQMETKALTSQIVTLNDVEKRIATGEHGNVSLHEMLLSAEPARKLNALEKKYDAQFKIVFDAIRELMTRLRNPRRRIGFYS